MRRVFPIWLAVVLGIASVNVGSAAGLQLACRVDGELAPIAAVDGKQIFVTVGGKTVAAPAGAEWTLTGEVRENARLLCWSPTYSISRRPEQPPGSSLRAGELVAEVGVARGMRRIQPAGWQECWEGHEAEPAVVVFAWLIDGKLTHIAAQAVPVVTSTTIFKRRVTIPLTEDEARGQPVLLRWDAQGWVPARPLLPSPRVQAALVDMMLDGRTDFTALSKKEVNEAGRGGLTLLHLAAEAGLASAVTGLTQAGARVDPFIENGISTPLHWAALKGRTAAVRALLDAGAAPDSRKERGPTPLMMASGKGHADVVRELLKRHATVNLETEPGGDALAVALRGSFLTVAEALVESGAKVATPDRQPDRILLLKVFAGQTGLVKFLLVHGADPKATSRGRTALVAATVWADSKMVDLLLAAGAPVDTSVGGMTALMAAAARGHTAVVDHLLKAQASVNATMAGGRTALHFAALGGDGPTIEALLRAGASVFATDSKGDQPLNLALEYGHGAAANILFAHGARLKVKGKEAAPGIEAAVCLDLDRVLEQALKDGWDLHTKFHRDWPILQIAKLCEAERCEALLVAAGARDVDGPTVVPVSMLDANLKATYSPRPADPRNHWAGDLPALTVTVDGVIDHEGQVLFPRVRTSDRLLTTVVLAAIRQWHFQPLRAQGKPAATRFVLPVAFNRLDAVMNDELDVKPKPLQQVSPHFPWAGRHAGKESKVVVDFILGEDGRVQDAAILFSTDPSFEEPALEAMEQWKFSPVERNGVPVRVHLQQPFYFEQ